MKWLNKQTVIAFILGAFIFSGSVGAATYYQFTLSTDSLYVNGAKVDKPLYKMDGSNVLPLRATAEAMGAEVQYSNGRIDISTLTDLETVVKNVKDSCVMIYVYEGSKAVSRGSGFVYDGQIITVYHLIDEGDTFYLYNDKLKGKKVTTVKYTDERKDIAILDADLTLPSVKLGDTEKLVKGEKLVSISSPGGSLNAIDECLFSGYVNSSRGTAMEISESYADPGASGGAVFNMRGEAIGMIWGSEDGVSAAVPIQLIKEKLN